MVTNTQCRKRLKLYPFFFASKKDQRKIDFRLKKCYCLLSVHTFLSAEGKIEKVDMNPLPFCIDFGSHLNSFLSRESVDTMLLSFPPEYIYSRPRPKVSIFKLIMINNDFYCFIITYVMFIK
jgi:chromosome condensin MukBEF MukE localization factor